MDVSAVKSTDHSCKGLEFVSRQPCLMAHNCLLTTTPGGPKSLVAMDTCIHRHIIFEIIKKII